jgi:hypothetical protein
VIALELVDADSGFAGLVASAGSIVFDHEEVLALAGAGEADATAGDGSARGLLSTPEAELELELSPIGPRAVLETEWMPPRELSICRGSGTLRQGGASASLSGIGILTQGDDDPGLGGDSLHRYLAIAFADGGLLALAAARGERAGDHGEEAVAAVLVGPDARPERISEALLSTEYDPQGRHRRATLELWPEGSEGPPLRAGGELICGTTLPGAGPRTDLAFLRWSMDGRPGLGRYEVVREAA